MHNHRIHSTAVTAMLTGCLAVACTSPAKIEITTKNPVLDKAGQLLLLQVSITDENGKALSLRGIDLAWYTDDRDTISLTQDGQITAKASGDATVRVEIVGTDLSARTKVTVQIPYGIRFTREKLRLVTGETVDNLLAEVVTSRGAAIPGLQPTFAAEDSAVLEVIAQPDPHGRGTKLILKGKNPGTTQVIGRLGNITASVRAAVFDGDEEINLVGNHISKKKERDARSREKKKEKPHRFTF